MVLKVKEPDMSCYPYRRKGLYFAITTPYLAVLVSVFMYLLCGKKPGRERTRKSGAHAIAYLALYLGMCYFQAYCCACQQCPYIGEFCPAIAGIYPANILAKIRYGVRETIRVMEKSEKKLKNQATMAGICWAGIMVLPLPRLLKRSPLLAAAYLLVHAVYYLFQGLTICPVCSIRDTCPGGALQAIALKNRSG